MCPDTIFENLWPRGQKLAVLKRRPLVLQLKSSPEEEGPDTDECKWRSTLVGVLLRYVMLSSTHQSSSTS